MTFLTVGGAAIEVSKLPRGDADVAGTCFFTRTRDGATGLVSAALLVFGMGV